MQMKTCRGVKQSPLHSRLAANGAQFRDVSGWESPSWYGNSDGKILTFSKPSWFANWEAEHHACRSDVALFDMSFMAKFLVQGRDAGDFLNRLSTANVDGLQDTITYTQWLNEDGYMEADLTVTKMAENEFLVVATDTMHQHVLSHMLRRLSPDSHVWINDATARYAQINLQGPNSRQLLQLVTPTDMYTLPFRSAKEIEIGFARVLCSRITYVGELGYELFVPVEQAHHVYDTLLNAKPDLIHSGLRALGSLRLEKGYRDYGHDIDNTDTIVECGLSFTCDFEKKDGFIGQGHVESEKRAMKESGLRKRMASVFLNDPNPLLHHGEILWRNGERISDVRSASFGHTLSGAVGLTMLETSCDKITKKWIANGDWEVEVADQRIPCSVSLRPFYDPTNQRIKGEDETDSNSKIYVN